MEFNANVNVQIGLTDSLTSLCYAFLNKESVRALPQPEPSIPSLSPSDCQQEPEQPEQPVAAPEQPVAAPEQPVAAPELEAPEITVTDVREAMTATKERVLGKDVSKDDPLYKQLRSTFGQMAKTLGQVKTPVSLETQEQRRAFIDECQYIALADGEIVTNTPY